MLPGNTGSTRFFSTLVFTAVSTDQGSTSERSCSGANGLFGLCTPAPTPMGTPLAASGAPNWAQAGAASKAALSASLEKIRSTRMR